MIFVSEFDVLWNELAHTDEDELGATVLASARAGGGGRDATICNAPRRANRRRFLNAFETELEN